MRLFVYTNARDVPYLDYVEIVDDLQCDGHRTLHKVIIPDSSNKLSRLSHTVANANER